MSLSTPLTLHKPLVVVMVGLPARGKTYIARKLGWYLSWLGYRAKVFNVGNYRRDRFGAQVPASFFDPDNEEGLASRKQAAVAALQEEGVARCRPRETLAQEVALTGEHEWRQRRDLVRDRGDGIGVGPGRLLFDGKRTPLIEGVELLEHPLSLVARPR